VAETAAGSGVVRRPSLTARLAAGLMCAALLAGCGRSLGERALGGGAIGLAAGAAGTAIFGGPILAGAAIGAAAGALGGVLLNPDVVDLGPPPL